MRDFRKYEVWQRAHKLALDVYQLTSCFPDTEKFGLTSQMRRAAISIPANITEGCGRETDSEFHRFLQISLGSAHETEYFLILSADLRLAPAEIINTLLADTNLLKQKLFSLSKSLRQQKQ